MPRAIGFQRLAIPLLLGSLPGGCADLTSYHSEFVDDRVVSLGTVETPAGPVELVERRVRTTMRSTRGPDQELATELRRGVLGNADPRTWSHSVTAVPGVGVIGWSEDARTHGSPLHQTGSSRAGFSAPVLVGGDPLRPERVLLLENVYATQTTNALVCVRGREPRRWDGIVGFARTHALSLLLLRSDEAASTVLVLGADLEPIGEPVAGVRRLVAFDATHKAGPDALQPFFVAPTTGNPAFSAVLGPAGQFVVPPHSVGVVPILQHYVQDIDQGTAPSCDAVVCWLVPEATERGLRWSFARPDWTAATAAVWKDVRVHRESWSGPVEHPVWLVAQREDGAWEALRPGPCPAPFAADAPTFPTPEAALAAANAQAKVAFEAWSEQHTKEVLARNAREIREDMRRREALQLWERQQEAQNSFFGTKNLIYGQPREQSLGEWIDARRRETIQELRDRGLYDAYGRPYDWLNRR